MVLRPFARKLNTAPSRRFSPQSPFMNTYYCPLCADPYQRHLALSFIPAPLQERTLPSLVADSHYCPLASPSLATCIVVLPCCAHSQTIITASRRRLSLPFLCLSQPPSVADYHPCTASRILIMRRHAVQFGRIDMQLSWACVCLANTPNRKQTLNLL